MNYENNRLPLYSYLAVIILFLIFAFIVAKSAWTIKRTAQGSPNWLVELRATTVYKDLAGINQVRQGLSEKLGNLEVLGRYGQWPLEIVTLSARRGNQFLRKD